VPGKSINNDGEKEQAETKDRSKKEGK